MTCTRSPCGLARAAVEHGYPITEFELAGAAGCAEPNKAAQDTGSKTVKSNAKKRAKHAALRELEEKQKQAASKSSSTTPPPGNYGIRAGQYVHLARYVAEHNLEVPDPLLHRIFRCIKLRMQALQRFLPNPDWSTFTHEHFINVLREVGSILHEAKTSSTQKASDGDGATDTSSSFNRFASLEDLDKNQEDYDDEVDEEPIVERTRASATPGPRQLTRNLTFSKAEMRQSCLL